MDKSLDIKVKMCRVCLTSDSSLENLYSLKHSDTLTQLKSFIKIDEEKPPKSKLPEKICEKCIPALKLAYEFRSLCEKTEIILNKLTIKDEPGQIEEIDVSKVKIEYSDDEEEWDMEMEVLKAEPKKPEKKKDEYIIFCDKCHRICDNKTSLRKHKKICDGKGNEDEKETSDEEDNGEVLGWEMQSERDDNDDDDDVAVPVEVEVELKEDEKESLYNSPIQVIGILPSDNEFECEKCKKIFKTKSGRGLHRKKCIKPGDAIFEKTLKSYECEVCQKNFQQFHTLKLHQKAIHSCEPSEKNVALYKLERIEIKSNNLLSSCEVCFKTFSSQAALSRHQKSKHDAGKFVCDICKMGFYTEHQLTKHKLTHTTERNFPCDVCTKAFRTPEHLKKHKKTHMSLEDRNNSEKVKKYLCINCGKILYTYTGYQTHLKIHTGERDFNCEICGKNFRVKAHLKTHMETMHVPDRPFKCNRCLMLFKDKLQLREHKKTHKNDPIDEKLCCEICGRAMKHKESLKHHVRNVHMGIRDFKCDQCDESFYQSNWLKKHKANYH